MLSTRSDFYRSKRITLATRSDFIAILAVSLAFAAALYRVLFV